MKQIPRVWHYVRRAWGTNGGRLVLPCRVLDQDADVTTVWHFRGAPILPGLSNYKYEVRAVEALVWAESLRSGENAAPSYFPSPWLLAGDDFRRPRGAVPGAE